MSIFVEHTNFLQSDNSSYLHRISIIFSELDSLLIKSFFYFIFFTMNIFIAGLSYNINDSDLADLFGEYGEIASAKVVMDRESGRSKGYGFVEMEDETAGQKAIEELNGAEYDGRVISVSVARPRTEGGQQRRNNNNGGGGRFRSNRERY